jgi:hypothetical protein
MESNSEAGYLVANGAIPLHTASGPNQALVGNMNPSLMEKVPLFYG